MVLVVYMYGRGYQTQSSAWDWKICWTWNL